MKLSYLHVLSEEKADRYVWLALSSAMSVRACDPLSDILLLVDRRTLATMPAQARAEVERTYSQVVSVEVPYPPGVIASRYLKTSMRNLVEGDFLYLDIDAMMLRKPVAIFAGAHDLGATLDRNWEKPRPHFPTWVIPHYSALGWSFSEAGYFNTGVLFMRDTTTTRQFGEEWHQRWKLFLNLRGKHQDQPAFNSLLGDSTRIKRFSTRYNAMVDADPLLRCGAQIIHYFLDGGRVLSPEDSVLWNLAERWRTDGHFDLTLFERSRKQRDPWIHPTNSIRIELACGYLSNALRIASKRYLTRPKAR